MRVVEGEVDEDNKDGGEDDDEEVKGDEAGDTDEGKDGDDPGQECAEVEDEDSKEKELGIYADLKTCLNSGSYMNQNIK
ncbi:MAG: hypothetical protein ACRDCE_10265, partial [Cetobacterium sp.]|uniref:hypothetical protein n=1 Tax=Cetobacterium sp. TaxID=2071632 RepID=UPI003EE6B8F9